MVTFILHFVWRKEDGFVTLTLHEGWVSYIVVIFPTAVDQNVIQDELFQIFQKEGQFVKKVALFWDPML